MPLQEVIQAERSSLEDSLLGQKANPFEDPEYLKLSLYLDVLDSDVLSEGIETREDLEEFASNIERRDPRSPDATFTFVSQIDNMIFKLFEKYGTEVDVAEPYSVSMVSGFHYPSEDLTTRVLPDARDKWELITRISSAIQTQERIRPDSFHTDYIVSGFDDWKAALAFSQYSHRWVTKTEFNDGTHLKSFPVQRAVKNNLYRYVRFGFTSEEAVRAAKPGALFAVENVFGPFAPEYVNGSIDRFKELLPYTQIKGAKSLFQDKAGGNYAKFKEMIPQ